MANTKNFFIEASKTLFAQLAEENRNPNMQSAPSVTRQKLLESISKLPDLYWHVRQIDGPTGWRDGCWNGEYLQNLIAQPLPILLRGGPYETEELAEEARHLADFNEVIAEYEMPPARKVMHSHPGIIVPSKCPAEATLIAEVKWTDRHSQLFYIYGNPNPKLWLLWQQYRNSGEKVPSMFEISHISQEGLTMTEAAKVLLKGVLEDERFENMKRISSVTEAGCLSVAEVEAIADEVWVPEEPLDPKTENLIAWYETLHTHGLILDNAAEALAPKNLPRSAEIIARTEVTYSMASESICVYYVSHNMRKRLWFLWVKRWDDNWSRWEVPVPIMCMPDDGQEMTEAALVLIRASWLKGAVEEDDGPFDEIKPGLIFDSDVIDGIANSIWPEETD